MSERTLKQLLLKLGFLKIAFAFRDNIKGYLLLVVRYFLIM